MDFNGQEPEDIRKPIFDSEQSRLHDDNDDDDKLFPIVFYLLVFQILAIVLKRQEDNKWANRMIL